MTIHQITITPDTRGNEKLLDKYHTSIPKSYAPALRLALPWDDLGITPLHHMRCCMAAPGLLNGVRRMSSSASTFRRLLPEDGSFEHCLHILAMLAYWGYQEDDKYFCIF